jgi:hypothetical protein
MASHFPSTNILPKLHEVSGVGFLALISTRVHLGLASQSEYRKSGTNLIILSAWVGPGCGGLFAEQDCLVSGSSILRPFRLKLSDCNSCS